MQCSVNWEKKGVICQYHGMFVVNDLAQTSRVVCGDARFDTTQYSMIDLLGITDLEDRPIEQTLQMLKEIAFINAAAARSNPQIKVVIITSDETIAAFAAYYASELTICSWQASLFENIPMARDWVSCRHSLNQNIHRQGI